MSAILAVGYVAAYVIISSVALRFSEMEGAAFSVIRTKPSFIFVSIVISLVLVAFVKASFLQKKYLKVFPISAVVPLGVFGIVLIQLLKNADWFKSYGDGGSLASIINESKPFSRWLLGSTALIDLFGLVNHFIFSISAQQFVELASAACMCMSSIIILQKYGNKAHVLLPLTAPIWVAFSFGYDEYYPFIVGIFMLVALWICVKPEEEFSYIQIGLTGVIPALYVGFLPLAVFSLVKIFRQAKNMKQITYGLGQATLAYLIALEIGWPAGHSSYLAVLSDSMNLGDTRAIHSYEGTALSSKLPFYSFRSVFSYFHLQDILFNIFFAGGVAIFLLLLAAFGSLRIKQSGNLMQERHGYQKNILAASFVLWNLFYIVFMIPKLGPIADIDLFFASNLVFAIWCGVVLENLFDYRQLSNRVRASVTSSVVALNGPVITALIFYGIRR